jgi:antirestriction protein ArdC
LTPEVREAQASYVASWIKLLKSDKRAIFGAASHAQRAVDFLHGLQKAASLRRQRDGTVWTSPTS